MFLITPHWQRKSPFPHHSPLATQVAIFFHSPLATQVAIFFYSPLATQVAIFFHSPLATQVAISSPTTQVVGWGGCS